MDPLCVEHRDALAEAVAAFAATEVDAAERARDEALKSSLQATLEAEEARAQLADAQGALREIERHCPCGARPESLHTHPHVKGPGYIHARVVEALRAAIAEEREACAKIVQVEADDDARVLGAPFGRRLADLAAAIRARA